MYIHPFERLLYQGKADNNAFILSPVVKIVKGIDPPDKKYVTAA